METNYTRLYRVFHWTIAISFFLLLITIFLRLTWMNKNSVAGIIGTYLNETGQTLTQNQLLTLAKQIREPMWKWHLYIGYFLAGIFSLRFILPLFGILKFQNPLLKKLKMKERFQKWVYVAFYLGVTLSLATGLLMEFGPRSLKDTLEGVHVLSLYYLIPFILIHLAGVITAEISEQKGIVSRLLGGVKATSS